MFVIFIKVPTSPWNSNSALEKQGKHLTGQEDTQSTQHYLRLA